MEQAGDHPASKADVNGLQMQNIQEQSMQVHVYAVILTTVAVVSKRNATSWYVDGNRLELFASGSVCQASTAGRFMWMQRDLEKSKTVGWQDASGVQEHFGKLNARTDLSNLHTRIRRRWTKGYTGFADSVFEEEENTGRCLVHRNSM